ncbi:hypothetical protein [Nocardioides sp.]|uniref:hypothetical protein n=1 Tax=Nocardioides sp. TaxID=35761 RepID=UPI00262FB72B|nr:hypothetical protein [Nocardioides sp.]
MTVDLGKKSGAISLEKGQRVTIEKTPRIVATVSFSAETDYDVYAVILLKDGTEKVCSTFGSEDQSKPTPTVLGVRHLGDVVRGGSSGLNVETLEIVMSDEIDQLAIVAYSAQSNGTGSFRRYQVSTSVDNQSGTTVAVRADQANSDDTVYTCVPALIRNTADGVVIERVEQYSEPGSEYRPSYVGRPVAVKKGLFGRKSAAPVAPANPGVLVMDSGSKNLFK